MEKKMVSTSQKISDVSCLLLLIPIMVSISSNIALTKKLIFPLSRKLVCASRMKDIEK